MEDVEQFSNIKVKNFEISLLGTRNIVIINKT